MWKETTKGWKTKVDLEDDKLKFKEQNKVIDLIKLDGGHQIAKLEMVGRWDDNEAVYIVQQEKDAVSNENAVWKVHRILIHTSKEQMYYAFRNAGKLTPKVR